MLLFSLLAFSFVRSDAALAPARARSVERSAGPAWPIRLIQLQLSVVYGVNALAKTTPHFLSGETLMALSLLPNFKVDLSTGFLAVGPFMLPAWFLATGVAGMEYVLSFAWWIRRLRPAVAVLGLVFHGVLTLVVQIGMLDVACLFLYAAFLLPLIPGPRTAASRNDATPEGGQPPS